MSYRPLRRPAATFTSAVLILTFGLLLSACASYLPWVPVSGSEDDIQTLEGRWLGTYESPETGRSGSIIFELDAASDSAHGDVMMRSSARTSLEDFEDRWMEPERPLSEAIPIRFVRAEEGEVKGMLATYRDPQCGCRLQTVFTGTVDGDRIEGTFTSHGLDHDHEQHGSWRVDRIE